MESRRTIEVSDPGVQFHIRYPGWIVVAVKGKRRRDLGRLVGDYPRPAATGPMRLPDGRPVLVTTFHDGSVAQIVRDWRA